jgi:hypothetical protein
MAPLQSLGARSALASRREDGGTKAERSENYRRDSYCEQPAGIVFLVARNSLHRGFISN